VHYVATGGLAAIVRSLGLTMYFKATVAGVPAACLMSSCCTNTLMSASYARQMGITVEPCVGEPLQAVGSFMLLLGFARYFSRCSGFLLI